MKLKNLIILSLSILLLFFLNSFFNFLPLKPLKSDFSEYWAAFNIASSGGNPYDPSLMFSAEKALGYKSISPLMMWNPPWILVILYPILSLPFNVSYNLFFAMNLVLLLLVNYLLVKNIFTNLKFAESLISSAVFLPLYYNLTISQVSVLLCFAAVLLYLALINKNNLLAALAILILSLKPHLFYLIFFIIFWQLIKTKNFKLPAYVISLFSVTLFLCHLLFPVTIIGWLDVVSQRADLSSAISPMQWQVPTLVGIVRNWTPNFSALPMILIPGLTCILSLIIILKKGEFIWKESYPILLAVSLFTSPFAWIFDYCSLVICQIQILSIAKHRKNFKQIYLGFLLFNILSILISLSYVSLHQEVWWYPALFLLFSVGFLYGKRV